MEQVVPVVISVIDWAAPVLFAPIGDERIQFYVEYMRLNSMTVHGVYPIFYDRRVYQ